VLGVVLVALVGAGIVIFGIGAAVKDLDTYDADLTTGSGDFPTNSSEAWVSAYTPDGFRIATLEPDQLPYSAVEVAGGSHTVLAVTIDMENVRVAASSEFGPVCWGGTNTPSSLRDLSGFRVSLTSDGSVALVRLTRGARTTIDIGSAAPFGPGTRATLQIVCSTADGSATVAGYVNGTRVVSAQGPAPVDSFTYTGFMGFAPDPSEWLVTSFARRGPDDLPPGWDSPSE
jgi:hypothetical protein